MNEKKYVLSRAVENEGILFFGSVDWDTMDIEYESAEELAGLFSLNELAIIEKYCDGIVVEPAG